MIHVYSGNRSKVIQVIGMLPARGRVIHYTPYLPTYIGEISLSYRTSLAQVHRDRQLDIVYLGYYNLSPLHCSIASYNP